MSHVTRSQAERLIFLADHCLHDDAAWGKQVHMISSMCTRLIFEAGVLGALTDSGFLYRYRRTIYEQQLSYVDLALLFSEARVKRKWEN